MYGPMNRPHICLFLVEGKKDDNQGLMLKVDSHMVLSLGRSAEHYIRTKKLRYMDDDGG